MKRAPESTADFRDRIAQIMRERDPEGHRRVPGCCVHTPADHGYRPTPTEPHLSIRQQQKGNEKKSLAPKTRIA